MRSTVGNESILTASLLLIGLCPESFLFLIPQLIWHHVQISFRLPLYLPWLLTVTLLTPSEPPASAGFGPVELSEMWNTSGDNEILLQGNLTGNGVWCKWTSLFFIVTSCWDWVVSICVNGGIGPERALLSGAPGKSQWCGSFCRRLAATNKRWRAARIPKSTEVAALSSVQMYGSGRSCTEQLWWPQTDNKGMQTLLRQNTHTH